MVSRPSLTIRSAWALSFPRFKRADCRLFFAPRAAAPAPRDRALSRAGFALATEPGFAGLGLSVTIRLARGGAP